MGAAAAGGTRARPDADPDDRYGVREERLWTGATVITAIRTVASVVLAAWAAYEQDLTLLVAALVVYWVGDMLDGFYARVRDCETRLGHAEAMVYLAMIMTTSRRLAR